jgi:hypothetical protein
MMTDHRKSERQRRCLPSGLVAANARGHQPRPDETVTQFVDLFVAGEQNI